ncbi:MAG: metallophosphoesterase family protein [Gammaproteobacteria bacterium]
MSHKPGESIVILHLSDLHAGQRFKKPFFQQHPLQKRCGRLLQIFNENTFGRLGLPSVDLLVLSGDLTDEGRREEFQALISHFLKPLTESGLVRNAIAVPGNHDVDWKLVRQPSEGLIPLHEFRSRISESRFEKLSAGRIFCPPAGSGDTLGFLPLGDPAWCQVVPFNSVNLGGTLHPDIKRYLKLDPKKAIDDGKLGFEENEEMFTKRFGEAPPIDPAFISDDDLSSVHTTLDVNTPAGHTPFRIAVIHHNPIAYSSEGSNPRPYRFLNDGAFNEFLIKHGFHLVLHGHQHVAELFSFSRAPSRGRATATAHKTSPALENGFLCLGAPSFGAEDAPGIGFNLIAVERIRDLATVHVQRLTWEHSSSGGLQELTRNESRHVVPLGDVDDRRRTLLHRLSIMVLNNDKLPELEREAGISATFEGAFFGRLRDMRNDHKNIRAMYSLSVFPAELWSEKRLAEFFLPEARRNIARAAALAKSLETRYQNVPNATLRDKLRQIVTSGTPNLLFRFSRPVHEAIRSAKSISEGLGITTLIRAAATGGQLPELHIRDRTFIERNSARTTINTGCADKSDSLSIWDNVCSVGGIDFESEACEAEIAAMDIEGITSLLNRVSVEDMRFNLFDPPYGFEPKQTNNPTAISKLAEFPRILLWKGEDFDSEEAIECIEFHENCAFPLFWIRPEMLRGTKGERKYIGHFTIVDANRAGVSSRWNDAQGDEPGEPTGWNPNKVKSLWDNAPPHCLRDEPNLIDEFVHLLKRPDIMFAADAWAMRKMGASKWDALINHLNLIDLTAWMNEPSRS